MENFEIDDILEDKNGKKYLVGIRNDRLAMIHKPKTASEREGECLYDYLDDAANSVLNIDLEKIGNYKENPNLLDDY